MSVTHILGIHDAFKAVPRALLVWPLRYERSLLDSDGPDVLMLTMPYVVGHVHLEL